MLTPYKKTIKIDVTYQQYLTIKITKLLFFELQSLDDFPINRNHILDA